MLVVRHKIAEAEDMFKKLETFLYGITSQFKFIGPQTDIPEDVILVILGYLGKITASLNTKYYYMWLETRGLRLTTKRVLMGDFNMRLSEYVRCLEINTDFDEFTDCLLSNNYTKNHDLGIFTKLNTIELQYIPCIQGSTRILDMKILRNLHRNHNEILNRIKKINVPCTCTVRFQCLAMINILLNGINIDKEILDKITFVHRSSGTSIGINDIKNSPWLAYGGSILENFYNYIDNYMDIKSAC